MTPLLGRYDASYGVLLGGDGAGGFTSIGLESSGLEMQGQVRDLKWLRRPRGGPVILVARNNDRVLVLRPNGATDAMAAATARLP